MSNFENGRRDAKYRLWSPPHRKSTYERIAHGDEYTRKQLRDRDDYKAGQKSRRR